MTPRRAFAAALGAPTVGLVSAPGFRARCRDKHQASCPTRGPDLVKLLAWFQANAAALNGYDAAKLTRMSPLEALMGAGEAGR